MNPELIPPFLDDLDLSLHEAWSLLTRGALDRRAVAHTPTLVTVTPQGLPSVRTVVLRGADRESRLLLVHTDRRSSKLEDLACQPRCAVHVYDAGRKLQLRLGVQARLHIDDDLADRQWARSTAQSRHVYGIVGAPGSVVDAPAAAVAGMDARSESEQRANFAVLSLEVEDIEWLYLSSLGHRRARFVLGAQARSEWLVP